MTFNVIYGAAVPLLAILLANTLTRAPQHKHHVAVLGLAIALVLTSFLTDTVKNAVGRARPDLLARCRPAPGTPPDTLVGIAVCTERRHHVLHDGWRSFPSGHSSFAFAGLGYLSLFLAGQVRLFVVGGGGGGGGAAGNNSSSSDDDDIRSSNLTNNRGAANGRVGILGGDGVEYDDAVQGVFMRGDLARALLCLAPLLAAAMISISRCQDYRHDVYDVCTGALLGWVVAYWSYRRYWPRLSSWRSHEPYPGPGGGLGGRSYGRLRDDEEGRARVSVELDPLAV